MFQKAIPLAAFALNIAVGPSVRLKGQAPATEIHAKMEVHAGSHQVAAVAVTTSAYVGLASKETCVRLCWIHVMPTLVKMEGNALPRNQIISASAQIISMGPIVKGQLLGLVRCPT